MTRSTSACRANPRASSSGWNGFHDPEIFSDDGVLAQAYPDSLRALEPVELLRRGREGFARCWEERRVAV